MSAIYPDLEGKCAVVTGGANGIGEAVVADLRRQKMRIVIVDRDEPRVSGDDVMFIETDLTDAAAIDRCGETIAAKFDAVHALCNIAGAGPRRTIDETDAAFYDQVIAVNQRSGYLMTRALLPLLRAAAKRDGDASVIHVGSITFAIGYPDASAYVSAKGAVAGMTRSMARALGEDNIRVNCVEPGWIMTENELRNYVTDEAKEWTLQSQCVKRLLYPKEIAPVFTFLASKASAIMTGQRLRADGGWTHV